MNERDQLVITNRDRLLRAWQNSTELVRDYENYAHAAKEENEALAELFAQYAEEEAVHASKFLAILQERDEQIALR